MQKGYLIADVGTGNTRVGLTTLEGDVVAVETCDTLYYENELYPDNQAFDPLVMWSNLERLTKKVLERAGEYQVTAITATSQREGIVLMDKDGNPFLGLPNIDLRGREWEAAIPDREHIYGLTGRWVNTIFSALKLEG